MGLWAGSKATGGASGRRGTSAGAIDDVDLVVESPEVVEQTETKERAREEIEYSGQPLAHVHPVDAEKTQEGEQDPGHGIVDRSGAESEVRLPIHRRNEKEVDQPSDSEQSEREEPDGPGDWSAVVETVRPGKPENPNYVPDCF